MRIRPESQSIHATATRIIMMMFDGAKSMRPA